MMIVLREPVRCNYDWTMPAGLFTSIALFGNCVPLPRSSNGMRSWKMLTSFL